MNAHCQNTAPSLICPKMLLGYKTQQQTNCHWRSGGGYSAGVHSVELAHVGECMRVLMAIIYDVMQRVYLCTYIQMRYHHQISGSDKVSTTVDVVLDPP